MNTLVLLKTVQKHGEGRSDVVVYDPIGGQAAIFEAKYSRSQEHLSADCDAALRQIDARAYTTDFEEYDRVFCYGFFSKTLSHKNTEHYYK